MPRLVERSMLPLLLALSIIGAWPASGDVAPAIPAVEQDEVQAPITDVDPDGPCKEKIASYCSAVKPGDGALAQCLRGAQKAASARGDKSPVDSLCMKDIKEFLRYSAKSMSMWSKDRPAGGFSGYKDKSSPFSLSQKLKNKNKAIASKFSIDPVKGMREACVRDSEQLCPRLEGISLLSCLKAKKAMISDDRCRRKLFKSQMQAADDMTLDMPLLQACKEDLQKLPDCRDGGEPGSHKACLESHMDKLSPSCRKELFRLKKESAEDLRLNVDVLKTCQEEITAHCADKDFGEARMLNCLWQKAQSESGEFGSECKEKIDKLTREGLQDYRLDFRIRSLCERDIDEKCKAERDQVDKMSIAQLFGGEDVDMTRYDEGGSGQVIWCLKTKLRELTSKKCQAEVQRVIRVQSNDIMSDPVRKRACAHDIEKYCRGSKRNLVGFCLRKNLKKLSAECKAAELAQGKLEHSDIRHIHDMQMVCGPTITQFCEGIAPGQAAIIRCLQDHMNEPGFSEPCKEATMHETEAGASDWRLKFGISQSCVLDLEKLCPEAMKAGGGEGLQCLVKKHQKVHSRPCKREIGRFVKLGANNIKLAPQLDAACVHDTETYCQDVKPGEGAVHACLLEHKHELSADCARLEFEYKAIQADSIEADAAASSACAAAMKKFCPDETPGAGKVWRCLENHLENQEMDGKCAELVRGKMTDKHSEFWLNPRLSKACEAEARSLCPQQMELADRRDFSSDGGVIKCLIEDFSLIKDQQCLTALTDKIAQRTDNTLLDPKTRDACELDVKKFCPRATTEVRKSKCLQKNVEGLSEYCKKQIEDAVILASADIRFNRTLMEACKTTADTVCQGVEPGEGRLIRCLLGKLHHASMRGPCKDALIPEMKKRAQGLKFNPGVVKACKADLDRFIADKTCQKATQGDRPGRVWRLECLTASVAQVQEAECKQAIMEMQQRQSADLRAKPLMEDACEADLHRLCPGVEPGRGRGHACLRKHLQQLQDLDCKDMVRSVQAIDQKSAFVNFDVQSNCEKEQAQFCATTEPGEQRLANCLALHKNEPGFSTDCKKAISAMKFTSSLISSAAAAHAVDELSGYLQRQKGLLDRHGHFLFPAGVVAAAILTMTLTYRLLNKKFKKMAYTVDVAESA